MRSAKSTDGLIEAARILSTLKMASAESQSPASHPSNAAFAEGIAHSAQQRVQDSSDRQQQHVEAGAGSDRKNSGIDMMYRHFSLTLACKWCSHIGTILPCYTATQCCVFAQTLLGVSSWH